MLMGLWSRLTADLERAEPRLTHETACPVCGAWLDPVHLDETEQGTQCSFCGTPEPIVLAESIEPPPRRDDVGEELVQARERLGESLADAAAETCIQERYLRALEDGEPLDDTVGSTYARFFLREYAEHLGLDALRMAPPVEPEPPFADLVAAAPARSERQPRAPWVAAAISGLALVAVLLGSVVFRSEGPERAGVGLPAAAAAVSPSPASPSVAAPVVQGEPIHVVLLTTEPCWVQVFVDGRHRMEETLDPGRRVTFRPDRVLRMRLGNPGGVELSVDGKTVRTGTTGGPVDLVVRVADGGVTVVRDGVTVLSSQPEST
jgi:hypothetical protein